MKLVRYLPLLLVVLSAPVSPARATSIGIVNLNSPRLDPPPSDEELTLAALAAGVYVVAAVDSFFSAHGVLPDSVSQITPHLPTELATLMISGRPLLMDVDEQDQSRSPGVPAKQLFGHFGYCRTGSTYKLVFFGADGLPFLYMFQIPPNIPARPQKGRKHIYD